MAALSGRRSVRPMFRNVVIGYDGPERGPEAVALGETLRDPRTGTLLLAAVYPESPVPAYGFASYDALIDLGPETERALGKARDTLPSATRVRTRAIAAPSAPRALTELAELEHADLVVVGSSHRGALGRVVPGTTADRLLHGAPCAVAVAPRGYRGGEVRHVGVAYDGSPEAEAALQAAEALALELKAALTVYCGVEPARPLESMIAAGTGAEWPSREAKEHARRLLYAVTDNAPAGLHPETLLLHGAPAEEIARRADGVIDVLFVGSRAYGPLRRALLGTVSGALVRGAGCPVIVIPRTAITPREAPETAAAARA
jgi:nucleotide-binding universal stress UspA family protein